MSDPKFGDVFRFVDSAYEAVVMYLRPDSGGWHGLVLKGEIDGPGSIEHYLPMEAVEGWALVETPTMIVSTDRNLTVQEFNDLKGKLSKMSISEIKELFQSRVVGS